MRGALSSLITTSFLPPQGLAPSLPPVTLTASGNNSMRSTPWGVEMNLRCAYQPWKSTLLLPCPCFSPPFQAPPPRGVRTFLGPPPPTPPSVPLLVSLQGSRDPFYSALSCSTQSPTAAFFFLTPGLSLPPAGPAAHTSTLRHLCLH